LAGLFVPLQWRPIVAMAFQKDAKRVMANERTFLEWMSMSVLIGGIGTSLLAFSYR
jgi:uncharacterized membrane protein YidH (DUF202 family)